MRREKVRKKMRKYELTVKNGQDYYYTTIEAKTAKEAREIYKARKYGSTIVSIKWVR